MDRGEPIGLMEPLIVGESSPRRGALTDLAVELAAKSAGFRRSLPAGVQAALADLVRAMNCYYSNLIEGHNTHPVEIERALAGDYSADPRKRDLQLEAKAHIAVQAWLDGGALGRAAVTADGVCAIHRKFCELLPDALLWVEDPDSGRRLRVVPGAFRETDVKVGLHVPVSAGAVPRFLHRFEQAYANLGKTDAILAAAAAHHRLLWIHPFLDGNGRVARLLSHAMLRDALDTGALWSAARGLARTAATYKSLLAAADLPRRNDLDGRGSLSEEALTDFTHFFLTTCLDQVTFMESLVEPDRLRARILLWAAEEAHLGHLPQKAAAVLEAVLYRGELPRGDVAALIGAGDRHARRLTATLLDKGILASAAAGAPLRLVFPATLAGRWMPGLFPEQP